VAWAAGTESIEFRRELSQMKLLLQVLFLGLLPASQESKRRGKVLTLVGIGSSDVRIGVMLERLIAFLMRRHQTSLHFTTLLPEKQECLGSTAFPKSWGNSIGCGMKNLAGTQDNRQSAG
jgi:hypothetical protein